MSRYIDADKLIHRAIHGDGDGYGMWSCTCESTEDFVDYIEEAPTADVAPVVHAHWNLSDTGASCYSIASCSNCGETFDDTLDCASEWTYCPCCGAKMDEVTE